MANPTAAVLIIGDEILSGRTRDINLHHLAGELTANGIDLKEARVVSDDKDAIIDAVRTLSDAFDHVFTSGGIGPTHDDITADCVAEAFGAHLDVREDAKALLGEFYASQGKEFTEGRLRMARIPDGAVLIDNPASVAPGFTLKNVHVMAGVPRVFSAMVAGLLPKLKRGTIMQSETLRIDEAESAIAGPLREVANRYPELSLGSYPFEENGGFGSNIVVRGHDAAQIRAALNEVAAAFDLKTPTQ